MQKFLRTSITLLCILLPVCASYASFKQSQADLMEGQVMAVAYSGFRKGQYPDRGKGAANPSKEEILEDLRILEKAGFRLIRVYDCKENSEMVLKLIREHKLPIKVLLGIWLDAEVSNHEGCAWLTEPIPLEKLAANKLQNETEVKRGMQLAKTYPEIIVAVNVGNEALVEWNDHMVPVEGVIAYVREVKREVEQPVMVADNYVWWIKEGADLAAELDYIGVHTYPVWEDKTIDEALAFTMENVDAVHAALPESKIVILEAGWATTSIEFRERANEANQLRYFNEIKAWARSANTTVFFFEAFDEPWKGDPDNPMGAEKHWGLFFVDRTPKLVMQDLR